MLDTHKLVNMMRNWKCSCLCLIVYGSVCFTDCLEPPEGISEEIFCTGCEVTVKELDLMLRRRPTHGIEETVKRALKAVCKKDYFDKYELDSKKALKVCKHITANRDLEDTLIEEYARKHEHGMKVSYLEMTQKVCGKILNACPKVNLLDLTDEEGGGITYNPETEEFEVKYGSKVRTPRPIKPREPELHKTEPEPELYKQETVVDIKTPKDIHIHKHEEL